jgi:hypothetical protein
VLHHRGPLVTQFQETECVRDKHAKDVNVAHLFVRKKLSVITTDLPCIGLDPVLCAKLLVISFCVTPMTSSVRRDRYLTPLRTFITHTSSMVQHEQGTPDHIASPQQHKNHQ